MSYTRGLQRCNLIRHKEINIKEEVKFKKFMKCKCICKKNQEAGACSPRSLPGHNRSMAIFDCLTKWLEDTQIINIFEGDTVYIYLERQTDSQIKTCKPCKLNSISVSLFSTNQRPEGV